MTQLPGRLGGEFSVASALASGATRTLLRRRDLAAPFWGVRMVRREGDSPEEAEMRRLRALAARLPRHAFFSHASAATVWALPLPDGCHDTAHVSVLAPHRAPSGKGTTGHQLRPELVRVRTHAGVRVASPASTWVQLATALSLRDLVAAGDAILNCPRARDGSHRPALATLEELEAAVDVGRRVGVADLRAALLLVRVGAASRPETHLRLALANEGLPEPVLDLDVFTANGARIGWTEIAYPRWRVLVEYEGDHHRTDSRQWNRDILKHDLCREAGWDVVRITAEHLYPNPQSAVARVRARLAAAGWAPGIA